MRHMLNLEIEDMQYFVHLKYIIMFHLNSCHYKWASILLNFQLSCMLRDGILTYKFSASSIHWEWNYGSLKWGNFQKKTKFSSF